jgi:hypothetical protein
VFTKTEVKEFIIKVGSKWFFPDFSNKLTWYVVTLGAGIILLPAPIKLVFLNWLIDLFNTNSGIHLHLPELDSSSDYKTGVLLIILALLHNLGYKYVRLSKEKFECQISKEMKHSDYKLLEKFLVNFPSSSNSIVLLETHDFGSPFNNQYLDDINKFLHIWNGAEYKFMDEEIEEKKDILYNNIKKFISKISSSTTPMSGGDFSSVTPDHLRGTGSLPQWIKTEIKEINDLASNAFKSHQELISFAKNNL